MTLPPLVTEEGLRWSFTFDGTLAPEYVLFTVRGQPSEARIQQMLAVLRARRSSLLLATGKLCPIIMDLRDDGLPDPAMLQVSRAALETRQLQFDCLIVLLDPARPDKVLMELSLEIVGQFLAPRFVAVSSWAAALAEVEAYHRQRSISSDQAGM